MQLHTWAKGVKICVFVHVINLNYVGTVPVLKSDSRCSIECEEDAVQEGIGYDEFGLLSSKVVDVPSQRLR